MGCDDDGAADAAMARDGSLELLDRRRVEAVGRLVEKPDRCRHVERAGKREPPALSGGEIPGRHGGESLEAERGERRG